MDATAVGTRLMRRDYPNYFTAILGNRAVVADHAVEHLDTREFAATYLIPNAISSMLDAPVWFRGKVIGVLCHEHIGVERGWTPEEVDFAAALANMISLALEAASRAQAEQEILHALAREKELNELKSRFVSMTSHEFRTPLTTILSSIELIQDYGERLPETEKKELTSVIKQSVKRMTELLDDILLIGKAEAGRLEFRPAPVSLPKLCEHIIEEVKPLASAQHEFHFDHQGIDRDYLVDEKLLRHILNNLLSNAVKYSPLGGPIRLQVSASDNNLLFRVVDRGIGVPVDDQDRIFGTFHRGGNVGNISGTGLGLAIVRKAVDLHSGKIALSSSLEAGTSFTVTIPQAQALRGQDPDR
jgi:signal transduction histidine kinase